METKMKKLGLVAIGLLLIGVVVLGGCIGEEKPEAADTSSCDKIQEQSATRDICYVGVEMSPWQSVINSKNKI